MIALIVLYVVAMLALAIALGLTFRIQRIERNLVSLIKSAHAAADCLEKLHGRIVYLERMFSGDVYRDHRGPTIDHEAAASRGNGRAFSD